MEFDINGFGEWVKKHLLGGIVGGIDSLFGQLLDFPTKIFDLFKNFLGKETREKIENGLNTAHTEIAKIKTNLTGNISPDFALAQKSILSRIDSDPIFALAAAHAKLDPALLPEIKELVKNELNAFFADGGIPDPENGNAVAAFKISRNIYEKLRVKLVGDPEVPTVGLLDPSMGDAKRNQEADLFLSTLTGIPAGSTLVSLAGNPPTKGIAGALVQLQQTVHREGYKDGTLKETDIQLSFNNKAFETKDQTGPGNNKNNNTKNNTKQVA